MPPETTKQSLETLKKACFDMKWICLLKKVFYAVCKYHASHYMFSHIILFWICYIEFVSFWGMVYGSRDIYATYIKLGMYIRSDTIPYIPHNIRIRLAWLKFYFVVSWDSQQGRYFAKTERNKKNSIGPILFLYYEESLESSNLNSKQLRFHGTHPNVHSIHFCL